MSGQFGDLAAGDGQLGEIVDLPGGLVGLALFNEHGWERRIVYMPADRIKVVQRAQDRPQVVALRDAELSQLTADYLRAHHSEGWGS